MKTKHILSITAIVFAIVFAGCSKDGATGPAGTAGQNGAAGAAGVAGATGATGAKGDTGTANVIYSKWVNCPDWSVDGAYSGMFYAVISAPRLDSATLASAEIKVYVNVGNASDPTLYSLPNHDNGIYFTLRFWLGRIVIGSDREDKVSLFRYVIIPGGTAARSAANAIDWNDYNAVKAYLGLKD